MHVIALENHPSSLRGGQELFLLDACRGLSRRGHDVSLLYLNEGNLLEDYQKICTHIAKVDSFKLDRSTIARGFNFLADIWKTPTSQDSVVFSNRYHDVLFGSALAFAKNIPHVCALQLPPLEHDFPRPLALGLKGVKKFIAVSNKTKLDWVKSGFDSEKIYIVHGGTNPDIFKPFCDFSLIRKEWNIPENTRIISYVGRLDPEKGLETLIKAFALLPKGNVNTRLLIAGKPLSQREEYKKSLEQLAIASGVEEDVNFLGHVANPTSVYQVSDVTVLPSLWSEPFPRTNIESMACGTPVVASRTGGIIEILTGEFEKGLFEPGNEQDLAATLSQILDWRD
ncbi:MAG TPA: glycosyltransferase family 1 protein, partial [Cyanobacteria bacterium UBA11049]|nr:glycosyltransferase family 1 protein [Cyanobacteria bacterium UBA11049]